MPSAQTKTSILPPDTLTFLRELRKHNEKPWFDANKPRYEAVKEAALDFVEEAGLVLRKISPAVVADPKPNGGSLMRIYRDTRFSKDKTPYKTHLAIGFHHRDGGEEHAAPGYYMHIEPAESMLCGGMWRPDTAAVVKIRSAIAQDTAGWRKATKGIELMGESLARPPKGFDATHPAVEDLKRKDFIGCVRLADKQVTGPSLVKDFEAGCKQLAPLNQFLANAVGAEW